MGTLIRGSSPKATIYTNANTAFPAWQVMVTEAFAQRGFVPGELHKLALKHGWEAGDSPMSFVDREIFRQGREIRNNEVKRCNDK